MDTHPPIPSLKAFEKRRLLNLVRSFKDTRILVLGDFILDQFVWGKVHRISPEAPVPVVSVDRESFMPGGALNTANNIRTLGGSVLPCGVIGRDLLGRMLLKAMRRTGIDTGGVVYDRERPTSLKTRIIAHSQQVVRFDREKLTEISGETRRRILRFVREKIKHIDAVIVEDYGKGVILPVILKEVTRLAKKLKVPVLVDPKEKHFSYYKGVTALTPNRKEAYNAFVNGAPEREYTTDEIGFGLLRKMKSEAVLITLGEDGMALYEKKGRVTKIPTAAREVYDVSGAGDTVIAVFGMALAAGANMREAAVISNLAAGVVVGKLGTATVLPEELREAIEKAGLR